MWEWFFHGEAVQVIFAAWQPGVQLEATPAFYPRSSHTMPAAVRSDAWL